MEASIQFNPSGGASASSWPAFWGLWIQHIVNSGASGVSQWAGQASGYTHYAEADIMEVYERIELRQYAGTIHDWSGTYLPAMAGNIISQNYGNTYHQCRVS